MMPAGPLNSNEPRFGPCVWDFGEVVERLASGKPVLLHSTLSKRGSRQGSDGASEFWAPQLLKFMSDRSFKLPHARSYWAIELATLENA